MTFILFLTQNIFHILDHNNILWEMMFPVQRLVVYWPRALRVSCTLYSVGTVVQCRGYSSGAALNSGQLSPVSGDNMIVNIVTLGNIILSSTFLSVLLHWQTFYCSQPGVVNVAGNFYEPGLMSINCVWQVWHISQMIVATGQVTGQCLIIQINWVSWCLLQCSSLSDQPLM